MVLGYYYAEGVDEKRFDNAIRKAVFSGESKAEIALYMQNQEILNQLRQLNERLRKTEQI